MPIYEYACDKCGHRLERLEKISAIPDTTCPSCHTQDSLHRLISAAGFQLKGAGWYVTDYKKPTSATTTTTESSTASSTDGSSTSENSESKCGTQCGPKCHGGNAGPSSPATDSSTS